MMECRTIICCTNDSWLPADDQDGYFRFETAPAIPMPELDHVEARNENPLASEPAAIRDAYERGEIEWPKAEQPEPIPLGVWWNVESRYFCKTPIDWDDCDPKELEQWQEFHQKWLRRRAEFPQSRADAERRQREAQQPAAQPDEPAGFVAGTGLMGGTEPGQRVTAENAHLLPAGSVVRLDDSFGVLIHLHDDLWYWHDGGAWCYDRLEHHKRRLPGTLCHIPVVATTENAQPAEFDVMAVLRSVRCRIHEVPKLKQVEEHIDQLTIRNQTAAQTIFSLSRHGVEQKAEVERLTKLIAELETQIAKCASNYTTLAMSERKQLHRVSALETQLAERDECIKQCYEAVSDPKEKIDEPLVSALPHILRDALAERGGEDYERRVQAFRDSVKEETVWSESTLEWLCDLVRKHFPPTPAGRRFVGWIEINDDGNPAGGIFSYQCSGLPEDTACTVIVHDRQREDHISTAPDEVAP